MRKPVVSVIGGRECNKKVEQLSHNLGKKLGKVGYFIINSTKE